MRPFIKWILQGCAIFAFLLVAVLLTAFAINFIYQRKAVALLEDIRTLRVEQSTADEVRQIMFRHGGRPDNLYASFCDPSDGGYDVETANQTINRIATAVPVLQRFGLKPWATGANVVLSNGRVCYVKYSFGMLAPTGKWYWAIETELVPSDRLGQFTPYVRYRVGTRDHFVTRWLRSHLTPEATGDERRRAFTYDYSCFTRLPGCRQRCEVAPLLWLDAYTNTLGTPWSMPAEETDDPRCKRLLPAP